MRLLVHNLLNCHKEACKASGANFPLQLRNVETRAIDVDPENALRLVRRMYNRLDYPAVLTVATELALPVELPREAPVEPTEDDAFLGKLVEVLFGVEVVRGELVCRHCQRVYPITDGIPNLLLNENEVDNGMRE